MFYLLYLHYADIAQDYPLLNLVQYQTVRVALAMATAMIVAVAMGSRFIAWMRVKQGKGQPIRSDGPISHLSKVGTPTMGGLMILAGIAVAVFLWGDLTIEDLDVVKRNLPCRGLCLHVVAPTLAQAHERREYIHNWE